MLETTYSYAIGIIFGLISFVCIIIIMIKFIITEGQKAATPNKEKEK